jgi:hypothetical protein
MHRLLRVAAASFGGALVCEVLFTAVILWSLPPSDQAYGQPALSALWDPFVIAAIVMYGVISGLVVTPLAYFLLRDRRILPCAIFTLSTVALEVVIVTPRLGAGGWFGAYFVLLAALLFCRFSNLKWFSSRNEESVGM